MTHVTNIHNVLTNETHRNAYIPEMKQRNDIEAQTSPIKETSSQVPGFDTESFLENQTRRTPVHYPNDPKKQQHEIQRNETDMTTHGSGVDNISPPKKQIHKLMKNL